VYKDQVRELYKPKVSDEKRAELEGLMQKLKTQARESKKGEDYIKQVYELNHRNKANQMSGDEL
jgi:hypothetical protein